MKTKVFFPFLTIVILLQGCSTESKEVQSINKTTTINTGAATPNATLTPSGAIATPTNKSKESSNPNHSIENAKMYFPKEKVTLKYSGGFENGGFTKEYQLFSGNKIQVRETSTGASILSVYKVDEEQISLIFSKENYTEDSYINSQPNSNNVLLKTPIEIGTAWKDKYGDIYTITGINVNVKTPAGNFECVEVYSKKDGSEIKVYYAKNIGLVKDIFKCDNFEAISELLEIKK